MTGPGIESLAHAAAVGVRLVDVITGRTVRDGIDVRMTAAGLPTRVALTTPSGVHAAHGLHRPLRWDGAGPDPVPGLPAAVRVEVRDRTGCFHSFVTDAVPDPAGLVRVACPVSPPVHLADPLPLFSLPARPVPSGMAAVRASLARADGSPAAHATLEVTPRPGAAPVAGVADERGQVLVAFPYPRPSGFGSSPPSLPKVPLPDATWEITLRGFLPAVPVGPGPLPALCTLVARTPARLVVAASPPTELDRATLAHGRDLVLPSLIVTV